GTVREAACGPRVVDQVVAAGDRPPDIATGTAIGHDGVVHGHVVAGDAAGERGRVARDGAAGQRQRCAGLTVAGAVDPAAYRAGRIAGDRAVRQRERAGAVECATLHERGVLR